MRRKRVVSLLVGLVVGLISVTAVWAQGIGSISGRVTDNSGAVIAAANVTVRNVETGEVRTTTTEESGFYRVLSLPVGKYEVKVEKEGFKTELRSGIDLVIGQEAVVNVGMEIGGLSQEVTVTGEAPLVNTTTSETSGLVSEQQVKDLPLNGRSYDNLITLNAGAMSMTAMHTTNNAATGGFGNRFSISGKRPEENLYLLNGAEYGGTGQFSTTPGSVSGQLLGIDAVREFNVLSGTYSAQYGKVGGGQISIVTTGGTNQLHGTVFEFLRNSALDARNFFDQPVSSLGHRIPHFERNNFGGALGGPIKKNKMFLFGNYEGLRQLLGLSNVAVVPDANARAGYLPCASVTSPPAVCPASGLTYVGVAPGVVPYLAIYPVANGPEVGGGAADEYNSARQDIREDFGTARFDYTISSNDSFNAVYTIDDGVSTTPQLTDTFITNLTLRSQVLTLSEVHIFSPNVLNTFTTGFSRAAFLSHDVPIISLSPSLSFIQGDPVGQIAIGTIGGGSSGGLTTIGAGNPLQAARNLFTETDNVQITKGIHLITLGVWIERLQNNDFTGANIGKVTFSTLQALLQGQKQLFNAYPFPTPLGFRELMGAWYVEDAIKLRPNLTLSLGLRHELTNGWNEADGRMAEYLLNPATGALQSQTNVSSSAFTTNNSLLLFGPRVGLAWDPFGNGKTAIRAGFGIHYSLVNDLSFYTDRNPPVNASISVSNGAFPFTQVTPQNVGAIPGSLPAPYMVQPNMKTPTLDNYILKIDQALGPNLALDIGYQGSHGDHGLIVADWNPAMSVICGVTGTCPAGIPNGTKYYANASARLNPALSTSKADSSPVNSNYNALIVQLTQRTKYGVSFKTNYTWSKSLDDNSTVGSIQNTSSTPLDSQNIKLDYGLSAYNIEHRFSFTGTYDLPFGKGKALLGNVNGFADKIASGWQLNSIVSIESGLPIDPQLGFSQSRNGNTSIPDRPSWNPNFTGNFYPHTVSQWYNAAAYILPTLGTYGDVARDSIIGPGVAELDMSLIKDTTITERLRMEFRAEGFNILNRANFGVPNFTTLNTNGTPRATAGQITSTTTTSRQLQFGVKMIF